MPVAANVLQVLENHNIRYQLKDFTPGVGLDSSTKTTVVRSALLEDGRGKVQVFLPSNHLLDLDTINRHLGRELRAQPTQSTAQTPNLSTSSHWPKWKNAIALVDDCLLNYKTVWLEAGDDQQMVEIGQESFKGLIDGCDIVVLSTPIKVLSDNAHQDKVQIARSIENFTQLRIQQRLEDTLELPPLPETAQRIIKLRADPNADISDLTTIVELDPALASQVVSWASSPYYSAPGKIKSVHDAVVRVLGFDMVLNLALGLALGRSMDTNTMSKTQIKLYWKQAVCTAASIEGLVTAIPREHRPAFGMSYLSGLLSNFGHLIISEVFPPYFNKLNSYYDANPHINRSSVEQEVISVSSCQIASWLMESWNMPEEVVVALRQQDNIHFDGEHAAYAKLIFIAKQLLNHQGMGHSSAQPISEKIYESLHLDRETAEATISNVLDANEQLGAIAEKMAG